MKLFNPKHKHQPLTCCKKRHSWMTAERKQTKQGGREGKAIGPAGLEKRLELHSLCQLASWAFVAVLITLLLGVGGENSPCGTISSGTFRQQENNCLPPRLGWDSHQAALGQESAGRRGCPRRASDPPLVGAVQKERCTVSSSRSGHGARDTACFIFGWAR